MNKEAEPDIPTMYPLKGECRRLDKAKQGIIDLTKKKPNKLEKGEKKVKKREK